jgi:transposase-like protein
MTTDTEAPTETGAAEAFTALQEEVAALGRKIEAIASRPNIPEPIDYGPSFGEVLGTLAQLETKLVGIAGDGSLRLTPDQQARAIERAKDGAFQEVIRQLREEAGAIRREREVLEAIGMHTGKRKRQRLWLAGAVLVGLIGYPLAAATLPGGSYLAAIATGTVDRWQAGIGLMHVADPEGARSIARATRIVNVNAEALRRCVEAARKAGREQKCTVMVGID